ncbi:ribonuclease H-like domain-containing protein [Paenibacillus sp. HWE-109]|uniref:ribonuclease H-like domain-containing protein n=1 Tax=Paenibacillus sp. HWE-109 TaxID=1306526 RepID=UPI001EDDB180|nr:ribonuclease H-like domain-containing protein [Paenibacillus sp. HWE-109]UKS29005.1 ribonuclease H-like domain-containing protein [Paenibacillus sp. HWE-109]
MSGLRERLGRLKGQAAAQVTPPPLPPADGEWAQIGAHVHTSPAGSFIMRRRLYGADSMHGKYRLQELSDVAQQLSCFHDHDAVVRHEDLLFFDTETTGLGVGAGNVPFMVGIGYYTGESFTVEQLLIRNPAEEQAMLIYLQTLLERFTHIVSYNGRTFDWPILKNRYVLNRLQLDDADLLQLDLLYPSRSIWRNTLPSCRLSKVEESRLGFERVDDVPGSMAPALYFQYLAEKNPSILEGVFIHNEYDIVTMAALATHFGKLLIDETEDVAVIDHSELEELFRTGQWLDKMNRTAKAQSYFDALFHKLMSGNSQANSAEQENTLLQLAAFYKKNGQYQLAVDLWKRWIEIRNASIALQIDAYLELAMYYEHRERNIHQAIFYAEEAWAKLWRRRSLHRGDKKQNEVEEALEKRIRRLKAKLSKTASPQSTRKAKPIYVSEGLI